jgi:hypothetical protein
MAEISELAAVVLDAYGGEARWRAASAVVTLFSMGGFLLRIKGHREETLRGLRGHTELARPHVRIEPIDADGSVGVLEGHDLRRESPDGRVLEERRGARSLFPHAGWRWLRWDRLDALYFVAYTQWIYNAFPALLWRDDIAWRQTADDVLEARFAPHLPTHSAVQRFYIDRKTGLLRRMDYTAEVFGGWAKGAQIIEGHGVTEGIPWPSRRRVWARAPDGSPRTSRSPLMVKLDVHEWRLT